MALKADGRIAIRQTLALAWGDLWHNWVAGLLLLAAPQLLVAGIYKWLPLRAYAPGTAPGSGTVLAFLLGYLMLVLLFCAVYVLFIRLFLLGRSHAFRLSVGQLAGYTLRFVWKVILVALLTIAAMFALMFALMIPMMIVTMILGVTIGNLGTANPEGAATVLVVLFLIVVIVVTIALYLLIAIRFYPVFFGASVGQNVRLREAWRAMSGYTWRTFIALLPSVLIMYVPMIGLYAYLLPQMRLDPYASLTMAKNLWWVTIVLLPLTYVAYGWFVAILSHIYRDLWPAPEGVFEDGEHPAP